MYQQLQAISREHHADQGIIRFSNYLFAKEEMLAEIVIDEIGHGLNSFPLCFFMQDERPCLAALLSVVPQRNLLVAPSGQWLSAYVPAILRAYPFAWGYPAPDADPILCVDTAVLCNKDEGEPLFSPEGELAPFLKSTFSFMKKYLKSQKVTRKLSADLHAAGLLTPWDLSVIVDGGHEKKITGVWQIDEKALKALPFEQLDPLRQNGALALAYAQLWSKSRMQQLRKAAQVHAQSDADKRKLEMDLDTLFGEGEESLKFDF